MTTHTPGPWRALPEVLTGGIHHVGGRSPIVMKEGRKIACVSRSLDARIKDGPCKEAEANARLIAAAPDLLAALKLVVEQGNLDVWLAKQARAAIAKAEGH